MLTCFEYVFQTSNIKKIPLNSSHQLKTAQFAKFRLQYILSEAQKLKQ